MLRTSRLVAGKDLRIEFRSRILLWQVLPFGVIALVLCALAVGPDPSSMRAAAPGLFYLVILLTTLLTIGRSQSLESPPGTRTSVQMLGLDPAGVFLGKAMALFVELIVTSVVILSGVVVLMHAPLRATIAAIPSIVLAIAALASAGTMYGALVGDSRAQTTLLPIVVLPPFAGILIVGEKAFSAAIEGASTWKWSGFLISALAAYLAVGILLYGVAEESS